MHFTQDSSHLLQMWNRLRQSRSNLRISRLKQYFAVLKLLYGRCDSSPAKHSKPGAHPAISDSPPLRQLPTLTIRPRHVDYPYASRQKSDFQHSFFGDDPAKRPLINNNWSQVEDRLIVQQPNHPYSPALVPHHTSLLSRNSLGFLRFYRRHPQHIQTQRTDDIVWRFTMYFAGVCPGQSG